MSRNKHRDKIVATTTDKIAGHLANHLPKLHPCLWSIRELTRTYYIARWLRDLIRIRFIGDVHPVAVTPVRGEKLPTHTAYSERRGDTHCPSRCDRPGVSLSTFDETHWVWPQTAVPYMSAPCTLLYPMLLRHEQLVQSLARSCHSRSPWGFECFKFQSIERKRGPTACRSMQIRQMVNIIHETSSAFTRTLNAQFIIQARQSHSIKYPNQGNVLVNQVILHMAHHDQSLPLIMIHDQPCTTQVDKAKPRTTTS